MKGWIYGRRLSACISVAATGQMSVEFDAGDCYENLWRKYKFDQGTLHENLSIFYCCQ